MLCDDDWSGPMPSACSVSACPAVRMCKISGLDVDNLAPDSWVTTHLGEGAGEMSADTVSSRVGSFMRSDFSPNDVVSALLWTRSMPDNVQYIMRPGNNFNNVPGNSTLSPVISYSEDRPDHLHLPASHPRLETVILFLPVSKWPWRL